MRQRARREVEVVADLTEKRVPDRSADQVQLVTGGVEARTDLVGDRGDAEKFRHGEAFARGQRVWDFVRHGVSQPIGGKA